MSHPFGAPVIDHRPLGGETQLITLADGRQLVIKPVSRQEQDVWCSGKPWVEAAAYDFLLDKEAPVPKLIGIDARHGWIALEFISGLNLEEAAPKEDNNDQTLFQAAIEAVRRLEQALVGFDGEMDQLGLGRPVGFQQPPDIGRLLSPKAQRALESISSDVLGDVRKGAWDSVPLGPTDMRGANALWTGERIVIVDLATLGHLPSEQRLAAYLQRTRPPFHTYITSRSLAHYQRVRGDVAALRLAYYDLIYWGLVLARLIAVQKEPESPAASTVRREWGDDASSLWNQAWSMWNRERLDDERIKIITSGLVAGGKEGAR